MSNARHFKEINDLFKVLEEKLSSNDIAPSRDKSIALTNLNTAYLWFISDYHKVWGEKNINDVENCCVDLLCGKK